MQRTESQSPMHSPHLLRSQYSLPRESSFLRAGATEGDCFGGVVALLVGDGVGGRVGIVTALAALNTIQLLVLSTRLTLQESA
jgi:hypothetical protein